MAVCVRTGSWIGPPQGKRAPRVGPASGKKGSKGGARLRGKGLQEWGVYPSCFGADVGGEVVECLLRVQEECGFRIQGSGGLRVQDIGFRRGRRGSGMPPVRTTRFRLGR